MAKTIRDLMTPHPVSVDEKATLREVAAVMRDENLGDVIVRRQGEVGGIVTDRDIVLRAVADGEDPNRLLAGDICSGDLVTLSPDDSIDQAAQTMVDAAVRRVPVMEGKEAVGIVALADLARWADSESVLRELTSEPPND
jgi:CBS domain-containing protein